MKDLRYVLIRYIRDRERMEPLNAGVILQGEGRIDLRLSPHLAKRADIETSVWRKWKKFFEDEVTGDAVPLFQPSRESQQFLRYLEGLCSGTVMLSAPLAVSVDDERDFDTVLDSLYQRLVAPPEDADSGPPSRPTAKFREIAERRKYLTRGMRKGAYITINEQALWMPYRQVENGELIAIDKVEVAKDSNRTGLEIEKLPLVESRLPAFLKAGDNRRTRFFLLVDDLTENFTDQTDHDFKAMCRELEDNAARIEKAGGRVLRGLKEVQELADEVDAKLRPFPASADA
jgi:hypothetical protein